MERYDYKEAVTSDVLDYIKNHYEIGDITEENRDEIEQQLFDDCFCDDSVTGNASGSYYCNAWKAEEALCHNLDLLGEAAEEFGDESITNVLKQGAEACDVTIRCYMLGQAIPAALDAYFEEIEETTNE